MISYRDAAAAEVAREFLEEMCSSSDLFAPSTPAPPSPPDDDDDEGAAMGGDLISPKPSMRLLPLLVARDDDEGAADDVDRRE
jgi:hypothetical protein